MAILKQVKINPSFEKLPLKNLFVYSIVISIVTLVLGLLAQIILPPEIPLFYGLPQTDLQLSSSLLIILPSLISILTTLVNTFISIKVNDNYLKKVLAFTTISVSILGTITTFKIIFLVGAI